MPNSSIARQTIYHFLVALIATLLVTDCGLLIGAEFDREFELPATDGTNFRLDRLDGPEKESEQVRVLYFFGVECPLSKLYARRLSEIQAQFRDEGIEIVGISSNQQDSMDELRDFRKSLELKYPLLKDYDNQVADQYQAQRTAEVMVVDGELEVQYRGAIDNQYAPGATRAQATQHYLKDALQQLIAGKKVTLAKTDPVGCLIGRRKKPVANPTVTFTKHVSRLIQTHCIECHRDGEIGPFDMAEYDEVKGWAEMIVEVIDNGRMPPWHATTGHAEYANARSMSAADKQVFRDWLEQGTPFGETAELPAQRKFADGWGLPKPPDRVIAMRDKPFRVPATGTVEYQYFVVDPGLEQDTWVTAAQVVPGNRSVVHHSIVFVRPPDGTGMRGIGWLSAYVPGQGALPYDPSQARLIPAGSKLVFQQHYTPIGEEQTDITKIGLVFGKPSEITHEVYTLAALAQEFEIPPNESSHPVATWLSDLPESGKLIAFTPHMHFRGKSFELFRHAGEQRTQLIDVPMYDFNWQHTYQLKSPINLADAGKFECQFQFDNSEQNLLNPDPNATVTWGDQTWEEMAVAFFSISQPLDHEFKDPADKPKQIANQDPDVEAFVDDYFRKFDANGDGVLVRSELPKVVRQFRFRQFDRDRDGYVSREEIRVIAADRDSNQDRR